MSTQRKLTDEERRQAGEARVYVVNMCEWKDAADGHQYWHGVSTKLLAMVVHGTTDGKPYVEPEPPIPDGYRLAVKGDEVRADCILWSQPLGRWIDRPFAGERFTNCDRYAVPADRVPTDADARNRPVVMVRDREDQAWIKRTLFVVLPKRTGSFITADEYSVNSYVQCRFPYPNETP